MSLHDDIITAISPYRGQVLKTAQIVQICSKISYPSGTGPVQPNDHAITHPLRPHCDFGETKIDSNDCCGTYDKPIFERVSHGYWRVATALFYGDGTVA